MRSYKILVPSLITAAILAACGGGSSDWQAPARYSSVVSFGDSLSDAGTYRQGLINAKMITDGTKGGIFTVNGIAGEPGADPAPSYTWAQLVSVAAVGKASCAARSGGFGTPVVAVPGCTNYAQGGSRVKDPKGVGNAVGVGFINGPLTEPVTTQIANYLAANGTGRFSGQELITVLAGANDIFGQSELLQAGAGQVLATSLVTQLVAGAPIIQQQLAQRAISEGIQAEATKATASPTSIVTAAVTAAATHAASNGYTNTAVANAQAIGAAAQAAVTTYMTTTGAQNAVTGMAQAANDLASSIKDMLAKGATRVVVLNLPDVSQTPYTISTGQQQLVLTMVNAFNNALKAALMPNGTALPGTLLVDAFAENQRQLAQPAQYGFTNTKNSACAPNALNGSSLVCNSSNLAAGNTSRYMFADGSHPTPYGHKLFGQFATDALSKAGWL